MEAQVGGIRGSSSSLPLSVSRRVDDLVLPVATRTSGVQQAALPRAVAPVFHRPVIQAASRREEPLPLIGARAEKAGQPGAPAAEPPPARATPRAPAFEWLDLELIPPGQKPDPRGYAIYSQEHRPAPAPVILIETAA